MSEDTESSYNDQEWTKQIQKKQKKGSGVFQSVFRSDDEETADARSNKLCSKKKVVKSRNHPSIFKIDSDDSDED